MLREQQREDIKQKGYDYRKWLDASRYTEFGFC